MVVATESIVRCCLEGGIWFFGSLKLRTLSPAWDSSDCSKPLMLDRNVRDAAETPQNGRGRRDAEWTQSKETYPSSFSEALSLKRLRFWDEAGSTL